MAARLSRQRLAVRLAVLVTVAALLAGCQHRQTRVALPGESPPPGGVAAATVKAGDEVRIVMRDGTLVGVTVAEIRADALVASSGRSYPFAEMVRLEIRAVSPGRSAGVAAGIIAGTVALFTMLMLAAGWQVGS